MSCNARNISVNCVDNTNNFDQFRNRFFRREAQTSEDIKEKIRVAHNTSTTSSADIFELETQLQRALEAEKVRREIPGAPRLGNKVVVEIEDDNNSMNGNPSPISEIDSSDAPWTKTLAEWISFARNIQKND
jgi:hypothetical protein